MQSILTNGDTLRTFFQLPVMENGKFSALYCDYTASGRSLAFLEDYIRAEVLPYYGNTHTTTSVTSLQTTLFRHEARDIIRNALNASEHDAVIFVGSGCTAAVHKLINGLDLKEPPIVFVGPFEHHSNLLPWRDLGAEIVRIQETSNGLMDLEHLDAELECRAGTSRQLIGSFSAASNITGILTDVDATTVLLHQHGALAFWDYATAAPYVKIDMNPVVNGTAQGLVYKDAVFFSPHKFIGGPETPGILVAKKKLFSNPVPSGSGGGSIFFVSRTGHRYLKQAEMREEGGTPAIVGAIRAGLVLQLKEAVTCARIKEREEQLIQQAMSAWRKIPELEILGSETAPRLPIFSLMVHHPNSGLMLHHNFLAALLNDLFGLQTRGGCACAGPYALDLLGIDEPLARHLDALLAEDEQLDRTHLRRYGEYSSREVLRPGFTRLNLAYFLSDHQVEFVLEAVSFVARHGWKFLPLYLYNPETGEWHHRHHQVYADRRWLGAISYNSGKLSYNLPPSSNQPAPSLTVCSPSLLSVVPAYSCRLLAENSDFALTNVPEPLHVVQAMIIMECLEKANTILKEVELLVSNRDLCGDQEVMFDEEAAKMRWFLLPSEAAAHLRNPHSAPCRTPPFRPNNHLNNGVTQPQMTCALRKPNKMDPATLAKWQKYFAMKSPWHCPPANIFKPFKQAVEEFGMIQNGDRVLACLSGGKDSLSMLHTLHQYQFSARKKGISFELGAMTVDPKSSAYDPSPLKQYLAALKVPYFYQEQGGALFCSIGSCFCSIGLCSIL
ncbi:hypothetical protein LAZ67_10000370 [Cordylochernes scorpioides]|uniref:Aminotransferase class V domain-containing protein n=1 Tax=Cordylochernes scorpioides TaxID=51811 RepID=A0ABY6KV13_9ARAC|nr:hypothetical protein LAZ67_10000370 [Cordylochernes scorpioides]